MNKITSLITSTIIIILLMIIAVFMLKNNKKYNLTYEKNITIKVGENIPNINDYITDSNATELTFNDIKSDNNRVFYSGIYKGYFKYNDKKYSVKLTVIDEEKPTITGVKDISIYKGTNVDLFENIVISDNSKDELSKKVEGTYNINKVGAYSLKYVIIDKSSNKTEANFKLNVVDKKNLNTNTSTLSSKGYKIEKKNGIYYVNGILIANKTYSLPSNYNPGVLLNDFMTNFNKMQNDAKKSNINLRIISGFRSYQTQQSLYNNYAARDGKNAADRYSARAGHSEHQTGLAADINSLEQTFEYTSEGKWLNNNCYKYGFIIRYPKGKESITGYMFEPWHIRYVGVDIATKLYNNGNWLSLEEYLGITSKY